MPAEEFRASFLAAIREAEEAKAEGAAVLAEMRAVQTRAMWLVALNTGSSAPSVKKLTDTLKREYFLMACPGPGNQEKC
jgi:hypothetical protein